jgi:hypothetical protein
VPAPITPYRSGKVSIGLGDGFRRGVKSDLTVRAIAKRLVDRTSAPAQFDARPAGGNRDRVSISVGQRDQSRDKVWTVGQNFNRYIIHVGHYAVARATAPLMPCFTRASKTKWKQSTQLFVGY